MLYQIVEYENGLLTLSIRRKLYRISENFLIELSLPRQSDLEV